MIAEKYSSDKIFCQLLDEILESAKLNGGIPPEIGLFLQTIEDKLPPDFMSNLLAIVDGRQELAA